MTVAPFSAGTKNASNSKKMADTAVSCLRTYGIEVVRNKKERSKSVTLTSGKTTIDFSYNGVKKLNVDLLEEIVRIFDQAGLYDVRTGSITDSTIFFKELVFSDMQANQLRVLAHFEFLDISIGYISSEISIDEIVNDFNDRHITVTQKEKKMAKARLLPQSSSITIESLDQFWLAEFIRIFADRRSISPTLEYSELPKHSMDRYKLAQFFQNHWSHLKNNGINDMALSRRLTQILVSDEDNAEAILVRVNHPKGSYMGARLGQKGLAILKSQLEILNSTPTQRIQTDVTHESPAMPEENQTVIEVALTPETSNTSIAGIIDAIKKLKALVNIGTEAGSKLELLAELDQCSSDIAKLQSLIEQAKDRAQEIAKLVSEPKELLAVQAFEGKQAEKDLNEIALLAI
jgi:hypothetical protein